MKVRGWTILFHDCLILQIRKLDEARARAKEHDPQNYTANANVKTLAALAKVMLNDVPEDPSRPAYRQGNTLGPEHRHWRRAKFGGRFRLFFRYDSRSRVIVYAWMNDEQTLRKQGSKTDPYATFRRMLDRGNPPDSWDELMAAARDPEMSVGDVFTDNDE
jgi:toxin YhaV